MQRMGRGTARRAVEGQNGRNKGFRRGIDVRQHMRCRNTEHLQAEIGQYFIALGVSGRPTATIMRFTVNLDDQLGFGTIKVGDVASNGVLAAELRAARATTQPLPQQHFRQTHCLAQAPGRANRILCPSTSLRLVPLPMLRMGRIWDRDHASSLSFTTLPPWVSRTAPPISSSSCGRPPSLSQKAERKLNRLREKSAEASAARRDGTLQ